MSRGWGVRPGRVSTCTAMDCLREGSWRLGISLLGARRELSIASNLMRQTPQWPSGVGGWVEVAGDLMGVGGGWGNG